LRKKDPKKKQEIIDFVDRYYSDFHCTPSTREISENISLGKSAVFSYLAEMRDEGMIDYDGKMIVTDKINNKINDFNTVGIIGSIPCGPMALEEQSVEEYVDLPIKIFGSGKLFLLHAYGDSMTGAGIDPGDMLVIDSLREPHNGDIVVAYVEGDGSTLKRFWRDEENGWIVLHPENAKYQDIIVKECQVQGVVRNVIKQM